MSNYYDMEQLRHSKKKITDIESLRVEGCRCCNNLNQYAITEIFRAFKESSSLKTFVLKCDALNEENIKLLREMTLRNKNITCLIIQIEGKYIPTKVLEAFCKLPLTTLSINCEQNNEGDNVYMDINPIIHIKTLRKLAISSPSIIQPICSSQMKRPFPTSLPIWNRSYVTKRLPRKSASSQNSSSSIYVTLPPFS
jgi:hypothetical protein